MYFISDFTEKLDEITEAVEQATFLSIDGEFTGNNYNMKKKTEIYQEVHSSSDWQVAV